MRHSISFTIAVLFGVATQSWLFGLLSFCLLDLAYHLGYDND